MGGELTEAWFAAYRAYRPVDDEAARAILTGSPGQAFATVRDDERRRRHRHRAARPVGGLGRHRRDVGRPRRPAAAASPPRCSPRSRAPPSRAGAASLHLQTDTDNTTALALYERHGFERHHAYVNLRLEP